MLWLFVCFAWAFAVFGRSLKGLFLSPWADWLYFVSWLVVLHMLLLLFWAEPLLCSPRMPNTRGRLFLSVPTRALRVDLKNLWNSSRLALWRCSLTRFIPRFWIRLLKWINPFGLRQPPTPASSATSSNFKNTRLMCNFCGIPGHSSPFCFKKRWGSARGRSPPYQRAPRAKDNSNPQWPSSFVCCLLYVYFHEACPFSFCHLLWINEVFNCLCILYMIFLL